MEALAEHNPQTADQQTNNSLPVTAGETIWDPRIPSQATAKTVSYKSKPAVDFPGVVHQLYGGEVGLEFYPKLDRNRSHVYLLDGQRVTSVSTICNLATPHGPLMWWAAGQACERFIEELKQPGVLLRPDDATLQRIADTARREHQRKKEEAANIGTVTHAFISRYIEEQIAGTYTGTPAIWNWLEPQYPDFTDWDANLTAVEGFYKWLDAHDVQWLSTERAVYSLKHGYCGQMDFEAVIDGRLMTGDVKTSNVVRESYRLQVAGYTMAREEEHAYVHAMHKWAHEPVGKPPMQFDGRLILRLSKELDTRNGTPLFEAVDLGGRDELKADFAAFLAAKALGTRLDELKAATKGGR